MIKYTDSAIERLKLRLVEKAMKDSMPKKYAGDMLEAAEVIVQLQKQYKALTQDIRENGALDICKICVGGTPPCNGEASDFECDTCTRDCRCRDCLNDCKWKWRGEDGFGKPDVFASKNKN
ncbi:MAG: hypothetical protein IJX47_02380 [Clostridia bacterium]|nr:hypothetical protein [Clostridia bacterium]